MYWLGWGHCHKDDLICSLKNRPTPEPPNDEDEDADLQPWFDWADEVEQIVEWKMSVEDGHFLMTAAEEAGYNRDQGLFSFWLYHRLGVFLESGNSFGVT